MEEFTWKGMTFVVKRDANGALVFRDKRHLGGPWTSAVTTVTNKSIDLSFRHLLKRAAIKVT